MTRPGHARPRIGLALAGGGPLGAVYEIGALGALEEALTGIDFTDCHGYVGVSAGAFIAAGLANGIRPRELCASFIENVGAEVANCCPAPIPPGAVRAARFGGSKKCSTTWSRRSPPGRRYRQPDRTALVLGWARDNSLHRRGTELAELRRVKNCF